MASHNSHQFLILLSFSCHAPIGTVVAILLRNLSAFPTTVSYSDRYALSDLYDLSAFPIYSVEHFLRTVPAEV